MKKICLFGLLAMVFIGGTIAALAAENTKDINSKACHLAMAQKYVELASGLGTLVREHEKTKADQIDNSKYYERMGYPTASVNSINRIVKHCDSIIRDANRLKGDYEEFAKWHRMMAAEANDKTGK